MLNTLMRLFLVYFVIAFATAIGYGIVMTAGYIFSVAFDIFARPVMERIAERNEAPTLKAA